MIILEMMVIAIDIIIYVLVLPILFGIYGFLRLLDIILPKKKKLGHWEMVLKYLDECDKD